MVGASLDAEMGPVVLFGTGGVDIELMKDVALAGAPLDEAEAKQLIGKTKAGVKMKGYRGKPALHRGFRRKGAGRPLQPDGGCR